MKTKFEPVLLIELKQTMKQRKRHKIRAKKREEDYIKDPTIKNKCLMLMAQEASRGSHIRAKKLHQEWQDACKVMYNTRASIKLKEPFNLNKVIEFGKKYGIL